MYSLRLRQEASVAKRQSMEDSVNTCS